MGYWQWVQVKIYFGILILKVTNKTNSSFQLIGQLYHQKQVKVKSVFSLLHIYIPGNPFVSQNIVQLISSLIFEYQNVLKFSDGGLQRFLQPSLNHYTIYVSFILNVPRMFYYFSFRNKVCFRFLTLSHFYFVHVKLLRTFSVQ